jgi:hypothetical protein
MRFIDITNLFRLSNLVVGGKEIVTSMYSNLKRTERDRERKKTVGRVQEFIRVATRERALL